MGVGSEMVVCAVANAHAPTIQNAMTDFFCKFPKSPLTGLFEETTACVEPDFEGRAWDEPAKSMVWLPIVIVIVVLILLVVAYMAWKKKNSGEAKEEAAAEDAKEAEPLNEQNV